VRYPTPAEIASAQAWALNPPDKRMHLVASVPVPTLLAFAHAASQLLELRDLLVKRDWHKRTGEPTDEVERELKNRSKALAATIAAEE
jgi:hypothetical protein